MSFKPTSENELATLTDEELVAYAVAARDAKRPDQFDLAVRIFIIGREPMVRAMVADKVPRSEIDDVVHDVLVSALESLSTIGGVATGQFVNWLKTITHFRIVDFHRKAEKTPKLESIDEGGSDEEPWFPEPVDGEGNRTGVVELLLVFEEVLDTFNETHQRVIRLRIDDFPSIEVAEILNEESGSSEMTPANVDKIFSRFKKALKIALGPEVSQ